MHLIPRAGTGTRLALVPVLLLLAAADNLNAFVPVLAVAFVTDAIDGYLARRFRLVSKLEEVVITVLLPEPNADVRTGRAARAICAKVR